MPFRSTYNEIIEMIHKAILDTSMCRAIVRRAGYWPPPPSGGGTDIRGTFSELTIGTGYSGFHVVGETSYYFPDGSEGIAVSTDFTGYTEARILVTMTGIGNTGATLTVAFDAGSFVAGAPSADMEEGGVHVSEWCAFNPVGVDTLRWVVINPSATGAFTVGLCQLQVR